jgi:glycosyltransferase involved in cell wall biosynthesis
LKIYVNGRFRAHKITGVQRYAHEVSARLHAQVQICQPRGKLRGWQGHLWEQTILPLQSRRGLLWSPCANGPISVRNQIVTFHDLFPLDSPEWYSKSYVVWYRFLMERLARASRHIMSVSEYTKRRLVDVFGIDPAKVTVVPNGVSDALFDVSPAAAAAAGAALQLPSRSYFLSVGSLEPRKNLRRLLAAWAKVVAELPRDLWLVVAGSNDPNVYRNTDLEKLPPRVHFTGYVPDTHLAGLYFGSQAFVYPSLAEGFGLPPLEAMACGVPVLTSKVTALPEVCGPDALYADPLDPSSIADGMLKLAHDSSLRTTLALAGKARARAFTWDRTAARTLQVLTAGADEQV